MQRAINRSNDFWREAGNRTSLPAGLRNSRQPHGTLLERCGPAGVKTGACAAAALRDAPKTLSIFQHFRSSQRRASWLIY
jgi:hypothetical protein